MRIGLIGLGVVGNALYKWLLNNTKHEISVYDPGKGFEDESVLKDTDAIFIAVPVPAGSAGQDISILKSAVNMAKRNCKSNMIFVRSSVLPGTNDQLGTISMPEFLTERFAEQDMQKLPILIGQHKDQITDSYKEFINQLLPGKDISILTNTECEITKYAHNCFGALKVTYFNIIYALSNKHNADYEKIRESARITGFIEPMHTKVPGPDGSRGFGGKCFPDNIEAMKRHLFYHYNDMKLEAKFFKFIEDLNRKYRFNESPEMGEI